MDRELKLVFATGNKGKVREAQDIFNALAGNYRVKVEVLPMPEKADIEETGATYRENALIKARWVHDRYGCDCFADDSGLEVDALDGAPGLYTARYCNHDFSNGIDLLLHNLKEKNALRPEERKARFVCCIALILDGKEYTFDGTCNGRISLSRCGDAGFGYDPVFMADETPGKCMAELEEAHKNLISHRGKALEEMLRFLNHR